MKKVIISSIVALALVAVASVSSASASYAFSNYLTVGSTGADVTALQSWLVSNGFLTMPAGVSMGYFGKVTKAAVVAYQASVGLPSTGFVGPLTIAKLNGAPAVTTTTSTFSCPVGWSCTAPATTNTTTTVNQNLTGITTPGVAGSLTIAPGSFTGNGTVVNDGQAVDVSSYDLQAGASDEQVSALTFDFAVRPWLYVNSFSLYNAATGATLATVSGLTQANFTELTVGSDYRLTIPGVSLVVPAGKKITVVLHAQFATSNRIGTPIYVTRAEVRAVDGTGVTITQNIGTGIAPQGGLSAYVQYAGQNNSNLIVTIDPSSPNTGIIQTNTGTTQTQNVLL
ncbi:MAG: peptidoglycan-binding domain-containing protein, partial [bacterium]